MRNDYLNLIKMHPEMFINSDNESSVKVLTDLNDIKYVENLLNISIGIVYSDQYICVLRDAVIFPNGEYGTYIRIMHTDAGGGVVLIPMCDEKILFVRHYRHALRKYLWELPRGFAEDNMSIEENSAKELYEETGLKFTSYKILGKIASDSGLMSTEPYIVLLNIKDDHAFIKDLNEGISDLKWLSKSEITQMIINHEIYDSFTLAALMLSYSMNNTNI